MIILTFYFTHLYSVIEPALLSPLPAISKMRQSVKSRVILVSGLAIVVAAGRGGSATNSAASVAMGDSGDSLVDETGSTPAVSPAALSGSHPLLDEGKVDQEETESSPLGRGGKGEERGGKGGASHSLAPITAPMPSLDYQYEGDYPHHNNLIASNHRYVISFIFSLDFLFPISLLEAG